jgi:hypothetical protein
VLITNLCSGGNDVGLVNLLNSCIYQMGVFTKLQAAEAKVVAEVDKEYAWAKDFDWDSLSRGCEGQIDYTRALATSDKFGKDLDALLAAAKKKLNKGYGSTLGEERNLLTTMQGQDSCHRVRQVLRRRPFRRLRQGDVDDMDLQAGKSRTTGRVLDQSTTFSHEQLG